MNFGPRKALALFLAFAVSMTAYLAWATLGDTGLIVLLLVISALGTGGAWLGFIWMERRLRQVVSPGLTELETRLLNLEQESRRIADDLSDLGDRMVDEFQPVRKSLETLLTQPSAQHEAMLRAIHAGFRRLEIDHQPATGPHRPATPTDPDG